MPDRAYFFSGITISTGDDISLSVIAYSPNSGVARIENLTNGDTVEQFLTSTYPLCGQDAEWIVEDYMANDNLVLFANFSTVTFTDTVAAGSAGYYSASQGDLLVLVQNDQFLTSASASGSSVTIEYV